MNEIYKNLCSCDFLSVSESPPRPLAGCLKTIPSCSIEIKCIILLNIINLSSIYNICLSRDLILQSKKCGVIIIN